MRLNEIFDLEEGGPSGGARYNSEIAFLYTLAGKSELNLAQPSKSFDLGRFRDPKRVAEEIDRFLVPNYNEKIFNTWRAVSEKYVAAIEKREGKPIGMLGWAGGTNKNDDGVADVVFYDYPAAGVSIKDAGGITLNNLTPESIGLDKPRGADIFAHLAQPEFEKMKSQIFKDVMNDAKQTPDVPQFYKDQKYSITYNSETDDFTMTGKTNLTASEQDIMSRIGTFAKWQRVFGDWFIVNWSIKKQYMAPLAKKVSRIIEISIEQALRGSGLQTMLQFADTPYYYATPKKLFEVPSVDEAGDLVLKRVYYGEPDGATQKFIAEIGHKDSTQNATVEIHVRYANGMFEAGPTVRVQSLKNPVNILWKKVI